MFVLHLIPFSTPKKKKTNIGKEANQTVKVQDPDLEQLTTWKVKK